ncbi:MAG: cyclic nucleotide-binding domain-containing protein [Actinomycetota bacterium]
MPETDDITNVLSGLSLFADLSRPELQEVSHTFEEEWFSAGQRILRQGFTGAGFYVILDGEATVKIDGSDRARLSRGDFFGEMSLLLGEPPVADVVAAAPLRCVVLPGPLLGDFLQTHPTVMFRMLQAVARRLRASNQWRS